MSKMNGVPLGAITLAFLSSSFSIFGSICILVTYFAIPDIRNVTRKFLLFLTTADMMTSLGIFAGVIQGHLSTDDWHRSTDKFCIAQSFVTTFSSMASSFWTLIIAVHLFFLLIIGRDLANRKFVIGIYHIIGWCIPGITTIVALAQRKLGRGIGYSNDPVGTGPWCWIKTNGTLTTENIYYMFFTGKGWEIFVYLISATLYLLMKVFTLIKRRRDPSFHWNNVDGGLRKEDEQFCLAWLVLYLLHVWGIIRFFLAILNLQSDHIHNIDAVLVYFQSYGESGQAFWNFVLFCILDSNVRESVRQFCCGEEAHNDVNRNQNYGALTHLPLTTHLGLPKTLI